MLEINSYDFNTFAMTEVAAAAQWGKVDVQFYDINTVKEYR